MMSNFAEFILERRKEKRITLREFVLNMKVDPCRWSDIERRRKAPTQSKKLLSKIAKYLDVEYNILKSLAERDKNIRKRPYSDRELVKHLPIILPKHLIKDKKKLMEFVEHMRKVL